MVGALAASTAPDRRPSARGRVTWLAGAVLALATVLVACEAGPTASPTATPPATTTAAPTATDPATASPQPGETAPPTPTPLPAPGEAPPLALERVAQGLSRPIGIVAGPDDRLWVVEQAGRIVAVDGDGLTSTVLDIADRISSGGERGLLGLALHPADASRAFIDYTDPGGASVLSELAVTPDGSALDPASERILLRVPQPAGNHNGGQLEFGPDGYLYVALGDGGGGGDQFGTGQDPSAVLGTILRLDVDGAEPYAIPPDNPFVDGGGAPEVYVYGLRNPWRFSFDDATGDLWIGDVGQAS